MRKRHDSVSSTPRRSGQCVERRCVSGGDDSEQTQMYASGVTATTQSSGRLMSAARRRAWSDSPSRTGNRSVLPSCFRTRYSRISNQSHRSGRRERDSARQQLPRQDRTHEPRRDLTSVGRQGTCRRVESSGRNWDLNHSCAEWAHVHRSDELERLEAEEADRSRREKPPIQLIV